MKHRGNPASVCTILFPKVAQFCSCPSPLRRFTEPHAAGEHLQAPYRDLGLTGRVPTLVHGDFVLAESSAIIEYFDEVFPAPDYPRVLPADVRERAIARASGAGLDSQRPAGRAHRAQYRRDFLRADRHAAHRSGPEGGRSPDPHRRAHDRPALAV